MEPPTKEHDERQLRPPPKNLFRIITIALILFAPVALELSLRLFGPWPGPANPGLKQNPSGMPLFEVKHDGANSIYTPSRYFLPWGQHYSFLMPKPEKVYRIFSLGGSATIGGAFGYPGAFSRWLGIMLNASDQGRDYEVINCGQSGFPVSEVKYLEKQTLKASPDLLVIYAGNNEFFYHRDQRFKFRMPSIAYRAKHFLEKLRIVRLLESALESDANSAPLFKLEPLAMREHAAASFQKAVTNNWDWENRGFVLSQFRSNLEAMVRMARKRGVKVILCTVAVNMRDYAPNGSRHGPGFAASRRTEWNGLVQAGKDAYARGDFHVAADYFLRAEKMDPAAAEADFFLGHSLLRQGRIQEAYQYFQAAVDHDPVRNRAGSDINAIIREVGDSMNVPVADVVEEFREKCRDGVPGDDLFLDNVHPTLEGHRIIARAVLDTMIEQGWVAPLAGSERRREQAVAEYEKAMPDEYLFNSYYTAASINALLGRFARARLWLEKARSYSPDDEQALKMQYCLDQILYTSPKDLSFPWSEIELIESYK
jgi:tetratricopeptide (TPR) repeat protein